MHSGPCRAPGALVELAQELLQLIRGLRKPSVACHFFHPLLWIWALFLPAAVGQGGSSVGGWTYAGAFPLLLLGFSRLSCPGAHSHGMNVQVSGVQSTWGPAGPKVLPEASTHCDEQDMDLLV